MTRKPRDRLKLIVEIVDGQLAASKYLNFWEKRPGNFSPDLLGLQLSASTTSTINSPL